MNKQIVLRQEDGDEIKRFKSTAEAYYTLKEVKEFDKRNGIKTNYYFELEIDINSDTTEIYDLKIYKYKGSIKMKKYNKYTICGAGWGNGGF